MLKARNSASRSPASCSKTMVLLPPSIRICGSIIPVSGITRPSTFSAYAIARQSGWQGTGTTSAALNTPDCS